MELNNTPHFKIGDYIFIPVSSRPDQYTNSFWAKVFEIQYEKIPDQENATSDTSVWKSSYNGEIFSKEEMDDWLENVTSKIQKLYSLSSTVLEIGCGNGLIFSSIISNVASYTGIDIAKNALTSIACSSLGKAYESKIRLYAMPADQIHTIKQKFDLIIINSVTQYFPDLNYFFDILEKCEEKLNPDGTIFIGDIRSFDLAEKFYNDIAHFKFPNDEEKARAYALRTKNKDNETLFSPFLFQNLSAVFPWIKSIEVSEKISNFSNEMSKFRFDVIIKTSGEKNVERLLSFPSITTLSSRISDSVQQITIDEHSYQLISLHPKLFQLAKLYDESK